MEVAARRPRARVRNVMGIFIRGKIDELSSFDIDPSRGCSPEAGNEGQVDLVEEWVKKNSL